MNNKIFKEKVDKHLKRIIGFVDVDSNSPTFGCADRNYWHYKLNDYYNARYQELALILAFTYLERESFLYKNDNLLKLIKGVINFWFKGLNKNGSVNEIYPHEQSFCATSFSAYVITDTLELLELEEEKQKYKESLKKVGNWLSKNGNWHIANQIAASACALYNISKILNENRFILEAERRINILLQGYSKFGYFSEYNGFDLGYSTLTMSLLMRIYESNNDDRILEIIKKTDKKLETYFNKFAQYDSIGMSRNAQFIYPYGIAKIKSANLEKIIRGLLEDKILNPDWLDDRYLIGLSNDYLMTYYL